MHGAMIVYLTPFLKTLSRDSTAPVHTLTIPFGYSLAPPQQSTPSNGPRSPIKEAPTQAPALSLALPIVEATRYLIKHPKPKPARFLLFLYHQKTTLWA